MLRQLGIAALILGAAVACGKPPDQPERLPTSEPPVWVEVSCPAQEPELDVPSSAEKRGGIPTDFETVAVVRCRDETRLIPGEGSWTVRITERADILAPELVDMLRRPSDPAPANGMCTAIGYVVPYVLLVNAEGKALLPALPTEPCGKPRDEVTNFFDTLPYRTVTETRVRLVESQLSVDTGCDGNWKDVIAIESPTPGPVTPTPPAPPSDIHVCVYTVAGDTGQLDSGFWLTEREASALRTALDAAGPAVPCDKPHTRFAVLRSSSSGGMPAVELDGCFRFQREGNTLGQLDENAVAVLTR